MYIFDIYKSHETLGIWGTGEKLYIWLQNIKEYLNRVKPCCLDTTPVDLYFSQWPEQDGESWNVDVGVVGVSFAYNKAAQIFTGDLVDLVVTEPVLTEKPLHTMRSVLNVYGHAEETFYKSIK